MPATSHVLILFVRVVSHKWCGFWPLLLLLRCLRILQLYEVEGADPTTSPVQRVQWLSYGTGPGQLLLQGHRILIVDEVS
jgi:hypothetical protein